MVKRFLNYVEIMTKITSTFAFLMTIAFLFYKDQPINWKSTLVFASSMFIFDLCTTAINNYIDTKTNDQVLQFKRSTALAIIIVLLGISTLLGLYLVYITDIIIFLIGGICFMIGILYTFGPVPISRQPLGEILSGVFYGFFIPFIILYINMPKGTYLSFHYNNDAIYLEIKVMTMLTLILFSVIPICTTANIMLANNICDLEKDIKVRRYTLPYYLGNKALYLFAGLYYITYLAIIIMVLLKILAPICLLSLLTIFVVQKNINGFFKIQDKATTFLFAIKNYIAIMGVTTLVIFVSGLLTNMNP
jgi:1,4-dihydroxy-2-naphthoate polyprenyltransferase